MIDEIKAKTSGTIDQMYTDFVDKLLPTIQEGLVITKDYFVDLFGRYVIYLIVTDVIMLLSAALAMFFFWKYGKKAIAKFKEVTAKNKTLRYPERDTDTPVLAGFLFTACLAGSFMASGVIFVQFMDIAKAVFIPEVRVYEEVMLYKNSQGD